MKPSHSYESQSPQERRQQLSLWRCRSGQGIHLRAGAVTLSFNKEEFLALTEACIALYDEMFVDEITAWRNNAARETEEILASEIIV